jgi:hypothetical protein
MSSNTFIYVAKGIGLSDRKDPRTGKRRKPQSLLIAARHNLREIQSENGAATGRIDASKIRMNEILAGPNKASEVQAASDQLFKAAGINQAKLRKDHSQASEHMLSLSSGQDERGFFSLVLDCFKSIYGSESILSAVVHRDEAQPHVHILVSPISGGINKGSTLHNHAALKENKTRLAATVQTIGFKPTLMVKRQQISSKAAAVLAHLEHIQHPMLFDSLWPAMAATINQTPHYLFEHFKLNTLATPEASSQERLRKPRDKSTALIKSEHDLCNDSERYIGITPALYVGLKKTTSKTRNLPSVGIGIQMLPTEPQFSRERDADLRPESFDCDTGEFKQS